MKRKIINTSKRKRIKKQAFENMRKMRENIDPALLEKAQKAIAKGMTSASKDNLDQHKSESPGQAGSGEGREVAIDRRKNLQTIMTLLNDLDEEHPLYEKIERDLKTLVTSANDQLN